MWHVSDNGMLLLGGDLFIDCPVVLSINDQPLVRMVKQDNGVQGIDFDIRDFVGHRSVMIRGGRVVRKDDDIDIIDEPNRQAAVERKSRAILAEVVRDVSPGIEARIIFQTFLPGGVLLVCARNGYLIREKTAYVGKGNIWKNRAPAFDLALTLGGAPLMNLWENVD